MMTNAKVATIVLRLATKTEHPARATVTGRYQGDTTVSRNCSVLGQRSSIIDPGTLDVRERRESEERWTDCTRIKVYVFKPLWRALWLHYTTVIKMHGCSKVRRKFTDANLDNMNAIFKIIRKTSYKADLALEGTWSESGEKAVLYGAFTPT